MYLITNRRLKYKVSLHKNTDEASYDLAADTSSWTSSRSQALIRRDVVLSSRDSRSNVSLDAMLRHEPRSVLLAGELAALRRLLFEARLGGAPAVSPDGLLALGVFSSRCLT